MIRKILFATSRQKTAAASSAGCAGKHQNHWAGSRPPPDLENHVSAVLQLLSVIEFSRQFPELTLHLAEARKHNEQADAGAADDNCEQLPKFPPLVAPDPRKVRASLFEKSTEEKAEQDEFALFAVGCLPPPPELDHLVQEKNLLKKFFQELHGVK